MGKMIIAKRLGGKIVIANDGSYLGKVIDLTINENTGRIENVVLEANPENSLVKTLRKVNQFVYLPYASVMSVSDYMIVDRKLLQSKVGDINEFL